MALLTSVLSGCSVLDTVNVLSSDKGSSRISGISYGPHARHRLDVYEPDDPAAAAPVILYFYGGAWARGERSQYEFVGRRFASMGYSVVIPDYRLYPEVTFPAFVRDGARAAGYVIDNMVHLFGERRPLFLAGHSAGAHIAMMLAVDERYLAGEGVERNQLDGVIGLAGPYDFLPIESESLKRIFPDASSRWESQPVNFIDGGVPPVLLVHGDEDKSVWLRNSVNLADRLQGAGNDVTLKIYPGLGHRDVLKPFVSFIGDEAGILRDIDAFISRWTVQTDRAANNRN